MATQYPIVDYTNRDYASLLTSLLDLAAQKLPEWTDRSENDPGRMLLEAFAYVGDMLLYYQDRIANEAFLSTAVERRSVIDLLSLIGYTLATPAPASAELTITAPTEQSVLVRAGATFATEAQPGKPAVEFIYLPIDADLFALDQYPPLEVSASQPESFSVIHATLVQEEVGTSTGEPNQRFRLSQGPVLLPRDPNAQDYFQVQVQGVDGGFEKWEKRGILLYSLSQDKHFTVQVDENDEAEIIFGDGTYGQIPPSDRAIRVAYLVGGGSAGNVEEEKIAKIKGGVEPPVPITQPKAASGGAERETIENARQQAPRVFRSRQRAVTEADYVALAENFPGVVRATAVAPSWNYVDLYVVAENFDLTEDLRARLLRYFEEKRMVTTLVNVRSPFYVWLHVTVDVGVEPTFYREDVKRRVEEALDALFSIDRLDFGKPLYLSKIYEAVEAVPGTDSAEVTNFQRTETSDPPATEKVVSRIRLYAGEFPRPAETIEVNVTGGLG